VSATRTFALRGPVRGSHFPKMCGSGAFASRSRRGRNPSRRGVAFRGEVNHAARIGPCVSLPESGATCPAREYHCRKVCSAPGRLRAPTAFVQPLATTSAPRSVSRITCSLGIPRVPRCESAERKGSRENVADLEMTIVHGRANRCVNQVQPRA